MAGFGQDHQHSERAERAPRDRVDSAQPQPDPRVSRLIALQQSAGNAHVSRLLARALVLDDGGPQAAAPASSAAPSAAPAAPAQTPAGGGQDALLGMTRVAWQTGVTQREKDAAAILHRPKAGKPDLMSRGQHRGAARSSRPEQGDEVERPLQRDRRRSQGAQAPPGEGDPGGRRHRRRD